MEWGSGCIVIADQVGECEDPAAPIAGEGVAQSHNATAMLNEPVLADRLTQCTKGPVRHLLADVPVRGEHRPLTATSPAAIVSWVSAAAAAAGPGSSWAPLPGLPVAEVLFRGGAEVLAVA